MADELYDPYDSSGGTGPGKPVISWKKADVGDEITGVIVPPDLDLPDKGYRVSREWDNDAKEPKVWAPKGYADKKGQAWKGPITESEYKKANGGSLDGARPVTRSEVTLVTALRAFEFVSGPAKQRLADEGITTDDGIRRIILDGQSLREAHLEALAELGKGVRPSLAQTWKVKLISQTPNDKGGHTNGFGVKITEPTAESRAIVAKYMATAKDAAAAGSDPYAGGDSEPPF